jgi:hypothetical protein
MPPGSELGAEADPADDGDAVPATDEVALGVGAELPVLPEGAAWAGEEAAGADEVKFGDGAATLHAAMPSAAGTSIKAAA